MFHAVRDWWLGGRGKMTARLFAFEFVVVVAGVLVAQALAGWIQQRGQIANMESERSRARFDLTDVHATVQIWRAASPCLSKRMEDVMAGKAFAAGALRKPTLVSVGFVPPSTEVMDLIRRHHGPEAELDLLILGKDGAVIDAAVLKIIDSWSRLTLVDPAHGPIATADRSAARIAAADIAAQLRRIDLSAGDMAPILRRLSIRARDRYNPGNGPAKSCDAIWRSGRINPPLGTR